MPTATVHLNFEQAQFLAGVNAAQARIARFGSAVRGMALFVAGGLATRLGSQAAVGLFRETTAAAGRVESMTAAMSVFTGSLQTARDLTFELVKAGAASPFGSEQYSKAGKALLGFGLSIDKVREVLPMLSDVAAAVEANLDELAIVFGKNAAQGRLYTRDVNEFATRGIRIWQALADEIGVPMDQVRKAVEQGRAGTKEMIGAFQRMTGDGGAYRGMTDQFRRTFEGSIKKLEGAWFLFTSRIGEPFNRALKPLFEDIVKLLEYASPIATRIGESFADVVRFVRLAFKDWESFVGVSRKIGDAAAVSVLQALMKFANGAREVAGRVITAIGNAFTGTGDVPFFDKLTLGWLAFKSSVLPALIDGIASLAAALESVIIGAVNRLVVSLANALDISSIPGSDALADLIAPKTSVSGFVSPTGRFFAEDSPEMVSMKARYDAMLDSNLRDKYQKAAHTETAGKSNAHPLSREFTRMMNEAMGRMAMEDLKAEFTKEDWAKFGPEIARRFEDRAKNVGVFGRTPDIIQPGEASPLLGGMKYVEGIRKGIFQPDAEATRQEIKGSLSEMLGVTSTDIKGMQQQAEYLTLRMKQAVEMGLPKDADFIKSLRDGFIEAFESPTIVDTVANTVREGALEAFLDAAWKNRIFGDEARLSLQGTSINKPLDDATRGLNDFSKNVNAAVDRFAGIVSPTYRSTLSPEKQESIMREIDEGMIESLKSRIEAIQYAEKKQGLLDIINDKSEGTSTARIASIVSDSFARIGAGGLAARTTPSVIEVAVKETSESAKEIARIQLRLLQIAEEQALREMKAAIAIATSSESFTTSP